MNADHPPKPLFVPLRGEWFDAFARGEKTTEIRLYGRMWNEKNVIPGRPVILSRGYSGPRLQAVVIGLETRVMDSPLYGPGQLLALIHLRVLSD